MYSYIFNLLVLYYKNVFYGIVIVYFENVNKRNILIIVVKQSQYTA